MMCEVMPTISEDTALSQRGSPEQRLGPGLALRAADGQHAGREGPAAGHAEGDAGEPEPGAAAPAGRHLRPRLSAAPAQLRPAAGKPPPPLPAGFCLFVGMSL
ncbi:unnamed protein product [Tetraodon nigroviridis]|uniref:(spotted green pufferfish) hypothetical protein n=1 Tax=Tetraodon nigroviridis TaxID=99883 RepID=Q4SAB6_TETNG|nr:unnamed protein product [Tetraodon nigroviridis]